MFEDADLRKLLTNFRETVISAHSPADLTSRKFCILRRGMIDHLIATQPRTVEEWRQGLPLHLVRHTEPEHWRLYAPRIVDLVRRIARLAPSRRVGK
jgi:hypothetical protein